MATEGHNVELSHLRPHSLSSHFSAGENESKTDRRNRELGVGGELRWPGRGSRELPAHLLPSSASTCPTGTPELSGWRETLWGE